MEYLSEKFEEITIKKPPEDGICAGCGLDEQMCYYTQIVYSSNEHYRILDHLHLCKHCIKNVLKVNGL